MNAIARTNSNLRIVRNYLRAPLSDRPARTRMDDAGDSAPESPMSLPAGKCVAGTGTSAFATSTGQVPNWPRRRPRPPGVIGIRGTVGLCPSHSWNSFARATSKGQSRCCAPSPTPHARSVPRSPAYAKNCCTPRMEPGAARGGAQPPRSRTQWILRTSSRCPPTRLPRWARYRPAPPTPYLG